MTLKELILAALKAKGADEKLFDELKLGEKITTEAQVENGVESALYAHYIAKYKLEGVAKAEKDRIAQAAVEAHIKKGKKKAEKEATEAAAKKAAEEAAEAAKIAAGAGGIDANSASEPVKALLEMVTGLKKTIEDQGTKLAAFGDTHTSDKLKAAKEAAILARYPKNDFVKKNLGIYVAALSAKDETEFDEGLKSIDVLVTGHAEAHTKALVEDGSHAPVNGMPGSGTTSLVEQTEKHAEASNEEAEAASNPEVASIPGMDKPKTT